MYPHAQTKLKASVHCSFANYNAMLLLISIAITITRFADAVRVDVTAFYSGTIGLRNDASPPPGNETLTVQENLAFKAVKRIFSGVELERVELGLRCLFDGKKKLARLDEIEVSAEPLINELMDIRRMNVSEAFKRNQRVKALVSELQDKRKKAQAEAEAITGLVQRLGGVFVKLAQNLAVRDDIVKSSVLRSALAVTMDANAPSGKFKAGDSITLGGNAWTIERSLNVGSVGEALLVTGSEANKFQTDAVLKVTYPERRVEFENDFNLLAYRYGSSEALPAGSKDPKVRAMRATGVTKDETTLYSIIGPMKDSILAEFDMSKEAIQTQTGAAAVQETTPEAYVPVVFFPTSTAMADADAAYSPSKRSFLVSEFIRGQSLKQRWETHNNWMQADLDNLIDIYGKLVLHSGYFMADPHPGNFMVTENHINVPALPNSAPPTGHTHGSSTTEYKHRANARNGLVILDWGNIGDLSTNDRCALALFYVALVADANSEAVRSKLRGGLGLVRYSSAVSTKGARSPGSSPSDCESKSSYCFPKSAGCPARFVPSSHSCSSGYFSSTSSYTCCTPPPQSQTLLVDYLAQQLGRPGLSADLVAQALDIAPASGTELGRLEKVIMPDFGAAGHEAIVPAARVVQVLKGLSSKAGGERSLRKLWSNIAFDVLKKCSRLL